MENVTRKADSKIDFILFIGDDSSNEPVFTYLNNKKHKNNKLIAHVIIEL